MRISLKNNVTVLVIATTFASGITISWLTLMPQDLPDLEPNLPVDKFAHVAAFTAFILPSAILRPRFLWWIFPIAALLGFTIEVIQPHVGRSLDWMDVVANFVGLIIGIGLGLFIRWLSKYYILPND